LFQKRGFQSFAEFGSSFNILLINISKGGLKLLWQRQRDQGQYDGSHKCLDIDLARLLSYQGKLGFIFDLFYLAC
jgi:hypothetical protein